MSPTVVGIDLSLTSTGLAVVGTGYAHLERVRTAGHTDDNLAARAARLEGIAGRVCLFAEHARPDLVVIEAPAFSRNLSGTFDRSGLWWLVVTQLLGSVTDQVVAVPPNLRAKYATGKGNAGKDEVLLAVAHRWADVCQPDGNDTADALVLASMGADHLGAPPVDLPASHREALVKVAWPAAAPVALR